MYDLVEDMRKRIKLAAASSSDRSFDFGGVSVVGGALQWSPFQLTSSLFPSFQPYPKLLIVLKLT